MVGRKLSVICALLFILPITAHAFLSFEDHVLTSFVPSVECVHRAGITGPLAEEVARWAIVRQLHENGLERPHTYSIPGMCCGGWNHTTLKWCLRRISSDIAVSRITDSEGMPLYVLSGQGANVIATASIAVLFDYYVESFAWVTAKEKKAWADSKRLSYLIAQGFAAPFPEYVDEFNSMKQERQAILRKCNGAYGPGRERIQGEVERLGPIFEYTLRKETR